MSTFWWCLHCERTFEKVMMDDFGHDFIPRVCVYTGCNASVFCDGWEWIDLRALNPSYPKVPIFGVIYPMYPRQFSSWGPTFCNGVVYPKQERSVSCG